ncbi:POZ/BTB containin G-protein 1 [Striga asiatica]|uniref:POZ/BTB containin G-protein 1 n=1 Tax=Striga asiatica TaxID=4170 RepID=A0A5A7PWT3_STRAF|nr:POZ/BTB containin G-protein 1 [Striga asiatica]
MSLAETPGLLEIVIEIRPSSVTLPHVILHPAPIATESLLILRPRAVTPEETLTIGPLSTAPQEKDAADKVQEITKFHSYFIALAMYSEEAVEGRTKYYNSLPEEYPWIRALAQEIIK